MANAVTDLLKNIEGRIHPAANMLHKTSDCGRIYEHQNRSLNTADPSVPSPKRE